MNKHIAFFKLRELALKHSPAKNANPYSSSYSFLRTESVKKAAFLRHLLFALRLSR